MLGDALGAEARQLRRPQSGRQGAEERRRERCRDGPAVDRVNARQLLRQVQAGSDEGADKSSERIQRQVLELSRTHGNRSKISL